MLFRSDWAGGLLGAGTPEEREALAVSSETGSAGLRFLPFLSGIGSPDYDSRTGGAFVGLGLSHGRPEVMLSVYEGVLLESRRVLEAVAPAARIERLVLGGGPSSGSMTGLIAEVLGRPFHLAPSSEASLLGAAAVAWRGAGLFSGVADAGRELAGTGLVEVEPEDPERYDAVYREYRSMVTGIRRMRDGVEG